MAIITKSIQRKGEQLILTNQRAVYWRSQNALILSDLHIGKTAHFRKSGIAVPSNILADDLQRLKHIIEHFNAHCLIIVGDLFHAEVNMEMTEFLEWRRTFKTMSIELIKGNHDRLKNDFYDSLGLTTHNPVLKKDPLRFIHDFDDSKIGNSKGFSISGHTHPGVSIKFKGRQRIKLPCYQLSKDQLVLPAFSKFTGLNTKSCPENAINIAFTDSDLFAVK